MARVMAARRARALGLLAALLLTACGGGGNDFPESAPTTTPTSDAPASTAPANPSIGTSTPNTTPPPPPPDGSSGDTQRPQVAMILPANNDQVSGNTQLLADATDNVGVAGVQFLVNNRALGGLIPTRPYTTNFDTSYLSDATHTFVARAFDVTGNVATSSGHRVRVSNTCKTAARAVTQWQNTDFSDQTGAFTAQWDVTPLGQNLDAVVGLARNAQIAPNGLSAIVRFNLDNTIDAWNDNGYAASAAIAYQANVTYRIRMTVDIARDTYSVFVTPAGGSEQLLAQDFGFRVNASRLDNWTVGAVSTDGALRACAFSVVPTEPTAANSAPVAGAGPDQTVNEGETVALNGTATDSDGTIVSVQWTQIAPSAPVLTINNANTLNASFVAPEVSANSVFSFQLTVTDNGGASASDTADITVNDIPAAPPPDTTASGTGESDNIG